MWASVLQIWQNASWRITIWLILKSIKTVEALPSEKRLDSDGNRLSESELYNNAVDSVQTSQLNYTEDEKKEIYLFSQLNAVGNFATGTIATDPLNDSQVAVIASISKEMPGISISTSWDRKVWKLPFLL